MKCVIDLNNYSGHTSLIKKSEKKNVSKCLDHNITTIAYMCICTNWYFWHVNCVNVMQGITFPKNWIKRIFFRKILLHKTIVVSLITTTNERFWESILQYFDFSISNKDICLIKVFVLYLSIILTLDLLSLHLFFLWWISFCMKMDKLKIVLKVLDVGLYIADIYSDFATTAFYYNNCQDTFFYISIGIFISSYFTTVVGLRYFTSGSRPRNVCRQTFKFLLPGKLFQSGDFFGTE